MANNDGTEGRLGALLRFLRSVVLADVAVAIAVGLVCWLGGWRTAQAFGMGLTYAGVGAMALGLFSVFGTWGMTRSGSYQLGQSVSADGIGDRTKRSVAELNQSYGMLGRMLVIGIVLIVAGSLIGGI